MPTYTFRCPACGTVRDVFARVSDKEANTPDCCGQKSETIIQPVAGYVQMECRYRCPATQAGVTSWKQRKEIFARHNLQDASDKNPQQMIAQAQKKREETARIAAGMPGAYKDAY